MQQKIKISTNTNISEIRFYECIGNIDKISMDILCAIKDQNIDKYGYIEN